MLMPDLPRSETESAFVCGCDESMRSACAGESSYTHHEGKQYCVLHFPNKKSSKAFGKALNRKLENKDFNFRGVWFPDDISFEQFVFEGDVDFSKATFSAAAFFYKATFTNRATFEGATFEFDVNLSGVTFKAHVNFYDGTFNGGADFSGTDFYGSADFSHASFNQVARFSSGFHGDANFFGCTFAGLAEFTNAEFKADLTLMWATFESEADFTRTTFDANVNLTSASFADSVEFVREDIGRQIFGRQAVLFLGFTRIDHPELVVFRSLTLQPTWFVNVDSRKFDFTDVQWIHSNVGDDLQRMRKDYLTGFHHPLLAIAYRRLAINAEENHRYHEASAFRYMAMDVTRHGPWHRFAFLRHWFAIWKLSWWYWFASGYGERVARALLVLLGVWMLSGLLYTRLGFARWEPKLASEADVAIAERDDVGAPLKFSRAMTYSASVMTLQKPEPRPATTGAQMVVLLETILGPVQAALLALAIRRKFMR
jgi:Pentapeptide repeats (9 copies)